MHRQTVRLFKEPAAFRGFRRHTEDCPRYSPVRVDHFDHMGPVRNSADVRLNPAVLPSKSFNLSVIDSNLTLRAKIPSFDCQIPVLLCRRSRNHRSFHGKLSLSVQVDPASGAAQRRQGIVIIDAGHELGSALPGDFRKLFFSHLGILRFAGRYYCKAARHCRRSHGCAG